MPTRTAEHLHTMSHYTLLVIGNNIEAQLAPFQENNRADCPKQYLAFNDCTDEVHTTYAAANAEIKAEYLTIEEYAAGYHGYRLDPGLQRFGYWKNPNAKWDWYVVGGRWSGMLKLKSDGSRVNTALIEEVDGEGMRSDAEVAAIRLFDKFEMLVAGRTLPIFPVFDEGFTGDRLAAYRAYRDHPVIEDLFKNSDICGCLVEGFCGGDRAAFIKNKREAAFRTFAVLRDGKWHERGRIGWFGGVHDDKAASWSAEYSKLMDGLPAGTRITVVDCHI